VLLRREGLGLAYLRLVITAYDYRDDQGLRRLLGCLLHYDLWLLYYLWLLVDWVLLLLLLGDLMLGTKIISLKTHVKHRNLRLRLLVRHYKLNRLLASSHISLISEFIKYPLYLLQSNLLANSTNLETILEPAHCLLRPPHLLKYRLSHCFHHQRLTYLPTRPLR
jgi:hypothetical protein